MDKCPFVILRHRGIMTRQRIAQDWVTLETLFNTETGQFYTVRKKAGRYTAATVKQKIEAQAVARGYTWKAKPFHGFGGYWAHTNGDTLEVLPGKL